ncbi:uncharacterized protein LOC6646047 isoform X5 [Drosophila willistoni]|uniref:uncharacterized protein LOC6646047 isoform X5 n=1 Tax=Drosophila willistoni TaxID=7260 RepID=UPI000C26D097|nr:uncharacterized protein LOC6646047 isoform X5 [Drosophila willistoni]
MPNNRNRNRNRNRNKRNRNQNQQQTKQEPQQEQDQEQEPEEQLEQPKEEREQQEETTPALLPTLDENENSGSNSNGSSSSSNTSDAQQALTKKTPSHEEATRVTVEADVVSAQQQQQVINNNNSSDDDDNNNNKMGAKNSKHQKEKREKSQEKLEEKHVEQSSTTNDKPPGSPRQVRVIVHRIVREDETDFARNDTQQQQEEDEKQKVAAQEEQLKVEQQQQYSREQEEVDLLIKTLQQPEIKQQLVKEEETPQQQQSFPQQSETIAPEKLQKTEIVKETQEQHVQQKQQHKIVLHKIQLEQEEPQSSKVYSEETNKVEKLQQTEKDEEHKHQQHIPLQQTEEPHKVVLHKIQLEQEEPQQPPPTSVQQQSEFYAREEPTQETKKVEKLQQTENIDENQKQYEQKQHVPQQQEQKTKEQHKIVLHTIHIEQQGTQQSPQSSDQKQTVVDLKESKDEEQLQQTENLKETQKQTVQQQYEQQQHVPQQQREKVVHHKIHQEQQQESPPLQRSHKVIIHKIHIETDAEERERRGKPTIEEISSTTIGTAQATAPINNTGGTLSPPPRYLVESPSPKTTKDLIPAQFLKSSSSGIQIQELEFNSDASSGEFNYPPLQSPLVSEVESETEATTPTQLPKTTSSPDMSSISRAEQQEQLRQKRAQKRNALETHFLPQLLSPRYLDSILEENGDGSTAAAAAATAEQLHAKSNQNSSSSSAQRIAKANEMFPKSQLDFSRRHKRREEPVALMLETRLLEQCTDDLESCTRLESTLSPQSEDAELVYLSSSASSSMSDLELELELEQAAALAERTLVDLDTDATKLMEGSQNHASTDADEMSSTTTTEPATETETETEVETEDGGGDANESRESTPVNPQQQQQQQQTTESQADGSLLRTTPTPTTTTNNNNNGKEETVANVAKENSVSLQAASSLAATREHFVRNMDKVRELIEMTRREEEIIDNEKTGITPQRSPSPPPRPPPPLAHPISPQTPHNVVVTNQNVAQLPSLISGYVFNRQESNESHCSDSTQHSQCTAINMASPPPPPTPPTIQQLQYPPIPPLPIQQQQQQPQQQEKQQPTQETINLVADNGPESDSIKKLRLLCTETLASMPYGEQVLEELANVAQNISKDQIANKMPYPMPDLPHIRELQLSTKENEKYTTTTTSSAWLGLPTEADPKLLVCLSPTQRELVEQQQQPKADQLLDDHQKFMERRGYNELSKEQVRVIDNEKQMEQQQQMLNMAAKMRELRKSLTPTPPPVPKKSAETAAKATATAATAAATSSSIENKPKKQTVEQQQSSHSTTSQMSSTTTSSTTATTNDGHNGISNKFPSSMESELARMFPSLQQQGDIFAEQRKRFSNIESESKNFPELKLNQNQSKRYSNIETKSYESKKRTENGQVIYDITNSSHEKQVEGDKDLSKADDEVRPPPIPPPPMMSETKLNGNTQANTFIKDDVFIKNSQTKDESKNAASTYEEFRQRAKAAVDAIGQGQSGPGLDTDNVFKDFDRLSQQLNQELQSTREHRQKSASLYDLSGLTRQTSCQSQQQLNQLKQQRHAHMQELEKEIERSAKSRMERMSSVEPKTYQIPIEMEANNRSRRSESLCNLNEVPRRPHTSAGVYKEEDDWSRYASDLGYSENIARPFAREVEICYQRQRPNHGGIRAPRLLSASSNDLSSFTSYDSFNAYGGRRTHAPMLSEAPQQQQQRPQYASCYSLIERNPNPTYISTTSRRGTSPAPPQVAPPPPPPAYDRQQRRSSLPRELHEQQLKYILSKEEELKLEVERLQHERRRLMEEMQRAPVINPSQRRESYRPTPKLPTLSEDEVFRQQMAEEWMNKVAERDERRHQKIIKISKIEDEPEHLTTEQANISDEFLNRVKERRHKLAMPADSDWESGAESQPQGKAGQSGPESEPETSVHILEGQTEANLRQLPRHLREFAKFSTQEQLPDGGQMEHHEQQEKREDFTDNSHSSATKKSSIIKTYKVSRLPPSVQAHLPATTMNVKMRPRPQKQTRFLLNQQSNHHHHHQQQQQKRRSWSESDLLKEIDNELQLAKGFLYANVYQVKHEYMSEPETEYDRPRKMAQLGRRQYEGIGPVTNDGMPIILRSEVQEPHQHEWYKRLYQTIHKQKNGARPSYKSNGYVSEPEPNYDSDYSTVRYRTQNPHRVQSVSSAVNVRNLNQDEKLYGTMPNPIKSAQNSYKNQPGRIENYTTGHSSVSEKEKKENLEQSKLSPLYTEGNLSRALAKESGYTSDSNLVFRKKELSFGSPLSPVEQKQAYKSLQAGGEPPLLGFRKPAPEKPKDYDSSAPPIPPQPPIKGLVSPLYDEPDVNIHFKTPVRHEYKQNISEEELAIRQAEHMQKLYQEERRRKYLQELQDMNSRRHTDNFTPSQKSPIALNRYDDFPTDVTLKSLVGPKTVAKALYNFQGQTSKELSFRKGDTIYIRRQIDANWFEGEHNAMIGLLPASYVEIVSRDGARTPAKRPSEGQARAKYNFQAQSGIELSLNKGELVTLTRRVDGNWFEGKIANRKGIFPVSYVEILTDIGAEDIAARTTTTVINSQSTTNLRPNLDVLRTNINNEFNTITQNGAQPPNGILKDTRGLHKTDALHVDTTSEPVAYRALYKYRPQNSDELELLEGDLVHVLEKCDDGWFVGTSQRTGCFGTFPGNYVERA